MESKKIAKSLSDPYSENLMKLAELFPSVVKDGEVDFDALKAELGAFTEVEEESYSLNWNGKQASQKLVGEPPVGKTLKYCSDEGSTPENTENIYIEGDNLEALHLLQNSYRGKIKLIYIDPPYNTGDNYVYNDSFAISQDELDRLEGRIDDAGVRLQLNPKTSEKYHANWLSMMYPRLKLAKKLLSEDGVIFISIGDDELANLKEISDEIFGPSNSLGIIVWESKTKCQNTKTAKRQLQNKQEYILAYKKKSERYEFNLTFDSKREYPDCDEKGPYRKEQLGEMSAHGIRGRDTMIFPILGVYPKEGNQWKYGIDSINESLEKGDIIKDDNKVYFKIREANEEDKFKPFWSFISKDIGTAENGKSELKGLIGETGFETVKPTSLIKDLLFHVCDANSIILDFFSGSGTTADAVMQLNAEDNGKRKFIVVQVPEICKEDSDSFKFGYKNISEIGKKRIKYAGDSIKKIHKDVDTGFKVFKIDDTNIRWIAAEKGVPGITLEDALSASSKDLRDFMPNSNDLDIVYEILIRQYDIPLSAKIDTLKSIGNRTYSIADTVIVCLEETVTDEVIDKIAAIEPIPQKIVFRDSAFNDDISLKENAMMRLDALMQKHVSGGKQPYSVEFL